MSSPSLMPKLIKHNSKVVDTSPGRPNEPFRDIRNQTTEFLRRYDMNDRELPVKPFIKIPKDQPY
ncbi:MAG: hypothetical protein ACK521_12540 [bacterium]